MEEINASIDIDRKLYRQDLAGSRAHTNMLIIQGIVRPDAGHAILKGLDQIEAEIVAGTFEFERRLEDIHSHIENRLRELIGDDAGRLHTARSRNDQVATDLRLWVRDALDRLDGELRNLQAALIDKAYEHAASVMPGLTHLQPAQPVTLGHHLLAHVEMIGRDRTRGRDCRSRLNECPLGAGALAGTSFPIDRDLTASALGFDRPSVNSMDAVSDRDFAIEFLAFAAIAASHLSRLGEEIVLWASPRFGYVRLSDSFSTGSSMLPQKRNPDAAELVRAKSGRIVGDLAALLIVMKGLPLAYSKDMQEDKEPVFDAAATLSLALRAMAGMIADMAVDRQAMEAAARFGFPTATDLADYLVRILDMPFRRAHETVGRLVRAAEAKGTGLEALSLDEIREIEPRIDQEAVAVLDLDAALESRRSFGGAAPSRVREAVVAARHRWLDNDL
jgi:argininosuccinate lyase